MGALTALSRLTHAKFYPIQIRYRWRLTQCVKFSQSRGNSASMFEPLDETKVLEGLKRFDPDTRSSMYFDLVSGKPMEVEALNGTVVRLGEQLG